MRKMEYKGIIKIAPDGESDRVLFIGDIEDPFAEVLESEIKNKKVTVRYFIADQHETKAQLIEGLIQTLYGDVEVEFNHEYSEYTGYLWTNEDLIIGGHDLLEEIKSQAGRFLYLEIDVHE